MKTKFSDEEFEISKRWDLKVRLLKEMTFQRKLILRRHNFSFRGIKKQIKKIIKIKTLYGNKI
jgi:hypothetical protein